MPKQTLTFQCLLISPGDVVEERDAVIKTLEQWSATIGTTLGATVRVLRWELARPEMGAAAQDVINEQLVDECDFGIAIFWSRLGSPTKEHPSGSAEEVARLVGKGANVMTYFSEKPVPHSALTDDQYAKLQALRNDYQKEGLLGSFATTEKLVEKVTLHVTSLVSALVAKARDANQPMPSMGSVTAPKPDVRVKMSACMAGQDVMSPFLAVEIQNHSPVDFFFASFSFLLHGGRQIVVFRDAAYGLPITPEKIDPGNGKTILINPAEFEDQLKQDGERIRTVRVRDKIDRHYFADEKQVEAAFKDLESLRKSNR